ncbi:MAG: HYR domain-containing protein [Armatimonadetes bacterium]|nr:HYR domain-containing protein [Armatimonadota bacterium]
MLKLWRNPATDSAVTSLPLRQIRHDAKTVAQYQADCRKIGLAVLAAALLPWPSASLAQSFHTNLTQVNAQTLSFTLTNDYPLSSAQSVFDLRFALSGTGEPAIQGQAAGAVPEQHWWVMPQSDPSQMDWFDPDESSQGNVFPGETLGPFIVRLFRPIPLSQPAGSFYYFAAFFDNNSGNINQQILLHSRPAAATHVMSINSPTTSWYVRPGETVDVSVAQFNHNTPVNGYQAFLQYDTGTLELLSATYTASPYQMHIQNPIPVIDGKINLDGQVQPFGSTTTQEGALASLQFRVPQGTADGITYVTFRQFALPTQFSDANGGVPATLVDSPPIVIDGTPPAVNCPPDIVANVAAGKCNATVALTLPSPVDALSGVEGLTAVRSDNNAIFGQQAFNAPYPVGTTTITWTVSDRAGNQAQCVQHVTVVDNRPPTIQCPADITVYAAPGATSAVVTFNVSGTDNCGPPTISSTPASGSSFPLGQTTVNSTASDGHGNSVSCSFKVTVVPSVALTQIDPQTFRFTICNWYPGGDSRKLTGFSAALSQMGVEPDILGTAAGPIPDSHWMAPPGGDIRTVEWLGPLTGGAGAVPPQNCLDGFTVRLPRPIPLTQPAGEFNLTLGFWNSTTSSNEAQTAQIARPASVENVLSVNAPPSSLFVKAGEQVDITLDQFNLTTPVNGYQAFLAFDSAKLTFLNAAYSTDPYNTHVIDPPVAASGAIDLDGQIQPFGSTTTSDAKLADFHFEVPAGTPDSTTQVSFRQGDIPTLFSDAEGGVTPVLVNGPTIVIDSTPPVITCPANITAPAAQGQCSASVSVTAATATDALSGVESIAGMRSDNGATTADAAFNDPFPLGSTTIIWTATDRAGNSSSCQQTVTVTDNQPPSITCPANITVYADPGSSSAVVEFSANASDDCGTPVVTCTPASGSAFPVGTTHVQCVADDGHGNTASCSFDVTVLAENQVTLSVELEEITPTEVTRCITFTFGGSGGDRNPYVVNQTAIFVNRTATFQLTIPSGAVWNRVSAKDQKHTLRRTVDLTVENKHYTASFTGAKRLLGGDLTNDNAVDIADFGVFAGQFGQALPPASCGFNGYQSDISGNGTVGSDDFSYIMVHFLQFGDDAPGKAALASLPVRTLVAHGIPNARAADLNNDGIVNATDVQLFAQKYMGARKR